MKMLFGDVCLGGTFVCHLVFNSELILKADSNVVGPTKGVVELQFPILSHSMGLPPKFLSLAYFN